MVLKYIFYICNDCQWLNRIIVKQYKYMLHTIRHGNTQIMEELGQSIDMVKQIKIKNILRFLFKHNSPHK